MDSKSEFTQSLYELVQKQKISLIESLEIISRFNRDGKVEKAARYILGCLEKGVSFSSALKTCNEIEFDNALSFINWEKVLNESCKALYSKSEIGAVARSITLEDLGYSVTSSGKKYAYYANGASLSSVSAPSGYTKKVHYAPLATTNNGYGGYRFWKYDSTSYTGNQTLGSYSYTYGYPTTTKPVLVTAKNDSVSGGDTEILNNVKGIISTANTSILLNDNYVGYGPIYLYNGSIMNYGLASSTGFKQFSITSNLRPVVSLSLSTTIDGQDANGAWQIVY